MCGGSGAGWALTGKEGAPGCVVSLTPFSSPHGGLESRNKRQGEWHAQFLRSFPSPASLPPACGQDQALAASPRRPRWGSLTKAGQAGRQGRGRSTSCVSPGAVSPPWDGQCPSWRRVPSVGRPAPVLALWAGRDQHGSAPAAPELSPPPLLRPAGRGTSPCQKEIRPGEVWMALNARGREKLFQELLTPAGSRRRLGSLHVSRAGLLRTPQAPGPRPGVPRERLAGNHRHRMQQDVMAELRAHGMFCRTGTGCKEKGAETLQQSCR